MKRFVWRLQKVLDVKKNEAQIRRTELFVLAEQLAAKRGELLMRQRILRDIMTDIRADRSPRRVGDQEFFLRHAGTNDEQIRRLREQITALEMRHKEKTAEVLALKRFKEGLEKLRAQAREEFIREQEKLEQKESDDRTTISFVRNESHMGNAGRPPCAVTASPSSVLQNQEQNR